MLKTRKGALVRMRVSLFLLFIMASLVLVGCSKVQIIKPTNGSTFGRGQEIQFQGQITRSSETGGEDRSNELSWTSSINGHIGDGASFTTNTLNPGSHNITATWPSMNRSDSISIQVNQ